jgi:hypothetical protein
MRTLSCDQFKNVLRLKFSRGTYQCCYIYVLFARSLTPHDLRAGAIPNRTLSHHLLNPLPKAKRVKLSRTFSKSALLREQYPSLNVERFPKVTQTFQAAYRLIHLDLVRRTVKERLVARFFAFVGLTVTRGHSACLALTCDLFFFSACF